MMIKLMTFSLSVVCCLAITTYSNEIKDIQAIEKRVERIQQFEADHKTHFQQGPLYKCPKDDDTCDPFNRYYFILPKEGTTEIDL
jgi:hypothetical protein